MVKILVVDDELDICVSLESILKREGYQVITAASGEEAIDKVKAERPHLILLDIRMPQMDGLQAIERIREIDKDVLITMVTVVADRDVAQRAIKLGAINYLVKPIDFDLLKRSLRAWAMQIEMRKFSGADAIVLEYNQEKIKTIMALFTKKGNIVKSIEDRTSEFLTDVPDLLILRADILGEDAERLFRQYKEAYPALPVIITIKPGSASKYADAGKVKRYGSCQYLPGFFSTFGLILIVNSMVSRSLERI